MATDSLDDKYGLWIWSRVAKSMPSDGWDFYSMCHHQWTCNHLEWNETLLSTFRLCYANETRQPRRDMYMKIIECWNEWQGYLENTHVPLGLPQWLLMVPHVDAIHGRQSLLPIRSIPFDVVFFFFVFFSSSFFHFRKSQCSLLYLNFIYALVHKHTKFVSNVACHVDNAIDIGCTNTH